RRVPTRSVTWRRGPLQWGGRFAGGPRGGLQQSRAALLEVVEHRQLELLRMWQPLEARALRRQFQSLRDQALIFAVEEETDLAKRFKVLFLGQLHHACGI